MRTFEHFPPEATCPICGSNTDSECILAPIDGTGSDNICEASPVHVSCLLEKARCNKNVGVIYAVCTYIVCEDANNAETTKANKA